MAKETAMVHKSVNIPPALNKKVATRLVREGRTFSDVVRDALEAYAGAKA